MNTCTNMTTTAMPTICVGMASYAGLIQARVMFRHSLLQNSPSWAKLNQRGKGRQV